MSKTLQLFFALLLWWVVPTQAQLTLSLPEIMADPGEQIKVDLEVENYTNIFLIQFTLEWDPEVLEFDEIDTINLLNQSNLLINLNNTSSGFFQFLYLNLAFQGETLEDHTPLLEMNFNVIGDKGDTSLLEITDDPTPFLAGDAATQDTTATSRNNGMVIVRIPDGVHDPLSEGNMTLHQNEPNPFRENTHIQFDLTEAEYTTFKLFDLSGKLILEQAQLYPAGSHTIVLEQHQLPSVGTYLYQIQTEHYLLTKKMNLVR